MRRANVSIAPSDEVSKYLTPGGTFVDGDLRVNRNGLIIDSQNGTETPLPDNQLKLEYLNRIKIIGIGSSGTVRLMQHKETGEFYALKVIKLKLTEDERKRIVRELKINQSVNCQYVVKCYQSFYDNGEILILLEYMDCGTLKDLLEKVEKIPERYLAAICKQLLEGLSYLHHHHKHIIHRDLKPANLLINQRGKAKISDFGVSAETEHTYGKAKSCVGTQFYMAPERIMGEDDPDIIRGENDPDEEVHDHKSDIWSLGLVLLECATGQFPYSLPEPDEDIWSSEFMFLEAVVEQPPPCAPSDQFTPNFCSFISSCLQKDPKDRKSARKLMEHPFITMYDNEQIDLSSYFKNAFSPVTTS